MDIITRHAIDRARQRWGLHSSDEVICEEILETLDKADVYMKCEEGKFWMRSDTRMVLVNYENGERQIITVLARNPNFNYLKQRSHKLRWSL